MWHAVIFNQPAQFIDLLLLGTVHGAVEINTSPNRRHQAGSCTIKVRLLPIQILLQAGRTRHKVHLQRAVGHLSDGQADKLAKRVTDPLQLRDIHCVLINLHSDERVKILDRHAELLCEKLGQIRHDRRAAVQERPHRVAASLLFLPKLKGLLQLNVQPGHHLPGDLGERRFMRVIRLGIRTTQADKPLLQLDLLRLRKADLRFRRELLRDRVGADVDGANKKFLPFENQNVCRLGTDIQHQRATLNVPVVVTERIDQCRLRRVHQFHVHTLRLGHLDHPIGHLALKR